MNYLLRKSLLCAAMLSAGIGGFSLTADDFFLTPEKATINGKGLRLHKKGYLEEWNNADCYPQWEITIKKGEKLNCFVEAGCGKGFGGLVDVIIDGQPVKTIDVQSVGHWNSYKIYNAGTATLKPGKHTIKVKAKKLNGRWLMHFRGLMLTSNPTLDKMPPKP